MSRPTYDQYRSFGHSRFVAFTLSIGPLQWFGAAALIGAVLGLVL
jgi:hypothetical protein